MSLKANARATLNDTSNSTDAADGDDDEDDEWRFYRTSHYYSDALYVKTDPRHLDDERIYKFRWVADEKVVASTSATWHAVEYIREVLDLDVLTPGIHDRQRMLHDYA